PGAPLAERSVRGGGSGSSPSGGGPAGREEAGATEEEEAGGRTAETARPAEPRAGAPAGGGPPRRDRARSRAARAAGRHLRRLAAAGGPPARHRPEPDQPDPVAPARPQVPAHPRHPGSSRHREQSVLRGALRRGGIGPVPRAARGRLSPEGARPGSARTGGHAFGARPPAAAPDRRRRPPPHRLETDRGLRPGAAQEARTGRRHGVVGAREVPGARSRQSRPLPGNRRSRSRIVSALAPLRRDTPQLLTPFSELSTIWRRDRKISRPTFAPI